MGVHVKRMYLVILCAYLSCGVPVSQNIVVFVRPTVLAQRGHMIILPCWLNPPQNAEDLEVRWYRDGHFDTPIMLYQKRLSDTSKEASYVGRVSFGLKDAESGGLKAGDVSLKLLNVTVSDEGVYNCYISSDQGYDKATVSLHVTAMGTTPFLSVVWRKENAVSVSCESTGWYPQPWLCWSDQKQNLTSNSLKYSKDSSGLVSVHSSLLVSSSSDVSCSVGLSDGEAKETSVHLEMPSQLAKQESGQSGAAAGWVAFGLLLIAALVLFGVLYFKKRGLFFGKTDKAADENSQLLPKDGCAAIEEAKNYYVNIKLNGEDNEYLTVKEGKLRDNIKKFKFSDETNNIYKTAIKGDPGFSTGKHYWEVSLGNEGLGLKQSWWVGVTNVTVPQESKLQGPNSYDGFWFLSSSPERKDSFQFSTEPKVSFPVHSRPQTIGVYLNYDRGELSFFNVEDKHVIGTLTAKFTGKVFPLFNPGIGDKAPMEILQRTAEELAP
ncbi:butyrophilin-like protein 3 [Mastacembelus armatus]|uniref:butyrophilin-like protein 3 n=1 Tax=Mastacembelus armatus TaxID=205130 RepID=UPI000E45EC4D|nr:butyrophilin-like protein 3 [Mastacembelus armatus]